MGSCDGDLDCSPGATCGLVNYGSQQNPYNWPTCLRACAYDGDCPETQYCELARHFNEGAADGLTTACIARAAGNLATGAACSSHAQCRSGFCVGAPNVGSLPAPTGFCWGICATHDDCANPNLECRLEALITQTQAGLVFLGTFPTCLGHVCEREADCGDWSCQVGVEDDPPDWVTRCGPPVGALGGAQPCTSSDQCRSGLCITGIGCAEFCVEDLDCATGQCDFVQLSNGIEADMCVP